VHGVGVSIAEHGDCLDTELLGSLNNTTGNLSSVGNEDLVEHFGCSRFGYG
jgi:hypothetical protein